MGFCIMKRHVHDVSPRQARRTGALWPQTYLRIFRQIVLALLLLLPFIPTAVVAHPMHSEAIERPCEIGLTGNKTTVAKGKCSFFIAAGYLIFEFASEERNETSGQQAMSGAINLTQSTGTLFKAGIGALANGAVELAESSPNVIHMEPGRLAAWDNGYALEVSGTATKADAPPKPVVQMNTETVAEVFMNYIDQGFIHIIPRGFDHILFVIGLFLLSPRLKPLLWQVSAFTVAHTITLALGASGIVRLSPAIVEPLIALSIVWIAVENLLTNQLHSWRVAVVFGFGLLHGLGFAGVLLEIGLSGAHFYSALLGFNVGVELGQLSVISLCFLFVGWMMKKPGYRRLVVVPASSVIALISMYWVVDRIGLV